PQPISPASDFRELRLLDEAQHDDLLTARHGAAPARIVYPGWKIELEFLADPIFSHWLMYAPEGKPFFALEPQTNANDGFNLYAQGIDAAGVFVLEPGKTRSGECRLRLTAR
ncbi:MAG: aldose epimerase, partial [Anaerolineae bacterium]|nr:aldose epimerase [Anaerolineae bacterium]